MLPLELTVGPQRAIHSLEILFILHRSSKPQNGSISFVVDEPVASPKPELRKLGQYKYLQLVTVI
ncbi:hypothetical protein GCM10009537_00030 [Corynebacterium riegelii]